MDKGNIYLLIGTMLLVSIIIFTFVKYSEYLETMLNTFSFQLALLLFILSILATTLLSLRWHYLLAKLGHRLGLLTIMNYTSFSLLMNYASPGKIGLLAKTGIVKKLDDVPINKAVPTIGAEIFFDVFWLILIVIILGMVRLPLLRVFSKLEFDIIRWIFFVILICFSFITIAYKKRREYFMTLINNTRQLLDIKTVSLVFLITTGIWSLVCVTFFLCVQAFGSNPDFFVSSLIFAIAFLVGMVSPSPGGLYVREGVIFINASLLDLNPAIYFISAVLVRLYLLVSYFIVFATTAILHKRIKSI